VESEPSGRLLCCLKRRYSTEHCAGCIQIHFQVDTTFIRDRKAVDYLDASTAPLLVRDVDSRTKVDSIYSYPQAATEEMPGAFNWRSLSGQDYLDLLG
jgi:hypothetical protein